MLHQGGNSSLRKQFKGLLCSNSNHSSVLSCLHFRDLSSVGRGQKNSVKAVEMGLPFVHAGVFHLISYVG